MRDQERQALSSYQKHYKEYQLSLRLTIDHLEIHVNNKETFERYHQTITMDYIRENNLINILDQPKDFFQALKSYKNIVVKDESITFECKYGNLHQKSKMITIQLIKEDIDQITLANMKITQQKDQIKGLKSSLRCIKIIMIVFGIIITFLLLANFGGLVQLEDHWKYQNSINSETKRKIEKYQNHLNKFQEQIGDKISQFDSTVLDRIEDIQESFKNLASKTNKNKVAQNNTTNNTNQDSTYYLGNKERIMRIEQALKHLIARLDHQNGANQISHNKDNPHNKLFTLAKTQKGSSKIVYIGTYDKNWYNFINEYKILPYQSAKYSIVTNGRYLQIGFCTDQGFGKIDNYKETQSAYYYFGSAQWLNRDGVSKKLSNNTATNSIIDCELNLITGTIKWWRDGNLTVECTAPESMMKKGAYLSILVGNKDVQIEVSALNEK